MFRTLMTAFWVDDDYDQDNASDSHSRYGAYLRDRAHRFDGEESPARFAVLAMEIGSSPIMTPGYVRAHSRICDWTPYSDDYSNIAFDVSLIVPRPVVVSASLGSGWRDWVSDGYGDNHRWMTPYEADRPAAWTTLTVRVPLNDALLPAPAYDAMGCPRVRVAQNAVRTVCRHLSIALAGVLADLER